MVKVMDFVRRRRGQTREEFEDAWRTRQAQAVLQARTGALGAYVQNFARNTGDNFSPTGHRYNNDFDVVDEYWVDARAEQARAMVPPLSGALAAHVDVDRSHRLCVQEVVLSGPKRVGPSVKVFIFIAAKPGLCQQRFFDHWTLVHGGLWRELRQAGRFVPTLKSVQNQVHEAWNPGYARFGYAGITEGWHQSLDTLGAPFHGVEHDEIIVPDANKFTDRAKVCDLVVEERVVFPD